VVGTGHWPGGQGSGTSVVIEPTDVSGDRFTSGPTPDSPGKAVTMIPRFGVASPGSTAPGSTAPGSQRLVPLGSARCGWRHLLPRFRGSGFRGGRSASGRGSATAGAAGGRGGGRSASGRGSAAAGAAGGRGGGRFREGREGPAVPAPGDSAPIAESRPDRQALVPVSGGRGHISFSHNNFSF
jgi:hypothetical protein